MKSEAERKAEYEADRAEAARHADALKAALDRAGIRPEPRPGFAARRNRAQVVPGKRGA